MSALFDDLKKASGGGIAANIYTWMFDPNFKAIKLYRYSQWFNKRLHFKVLPRLLNIRSRRKYGIDIDFGAEIGSGFSIKHGVGIVIGRWVHAGNNLTIYQGVTLGGNSGKEREYNGLRIVQPYIGNGVKLYSNCMVLGPVVIGDYSEVGAGAVITKDIPENQVVFREGKLRFKEKQEITN